MKKILVSVNIITLGRPTLYKTLESVCNQVFSRPYEINLILQWDIDQKVIDKLNKKNISIHIHTYKHWLGFWYYRNEAIKRSNGDILVWIDDDEWTKDNKRLDSITEPILKEEYGVVTAWVEVQLGKWYRTDCISLLWYPWWWAIGFKKLWTVNTNWTTQHLCSGNFAFDRAILKKIWLFQASLKSWAEDVAFAEAVNKQNINILYNEASTVYHIHRSWFVNFCRWHFIRGRSAYEFSKLGIINQNHKKEKMKSIRNILFNRTMGIKYFPWVRFMFFVQYLFQIIGMVYAKTTT